MLNETQRGKVKRVWAASTECVVAAAQGAFPTARQSVSFRRRVAPADWLGVLFPSLICALRLAPGGRRVVGPAREIVWNGGCCPAVLVARSATSGGRPPAASINAAAAAEEIAYSRTLFATLYSVPV